MASSAAATAERIVARPSRHDPVARAKGSSAIRRAQSARSAKVFGVAVVLVDQARQSFLTPLRSTVPPKNTGSAQDRDRPGQQAGQVSAVRPHLAQGAVAVRRWKAMTPRVGLQRAQRGGDFVGVVAKSSMTVMPGKCRQCRSGGRGRQNWRAPL